MFTHAPTKLFVHQTLFDRAMISDRLAEVRRIEEQTHQHTAESASNRDRHDPCSD
jgi:hypothetical protein